MDNTNLIKVKIMSPKELLYEGPAIAVSSQNSSGKFDIISQHANFISIVENQPITVLKPDNSSQTFKFTQAIIYNKGGQVSVYAEPLSVQTETKQAI